MSADDELPEGPAPELDARDHAIIAAVRGLDRSGAPDWAALEASIQAATTRAPRRRRGALIGGALVVAALAAALALYLARPGAHRPWTVAMPTPPAPTAVPSDDPGDDGDLRDDEVAPDEVALAAADDDGDLGAMGAIDDALVDEVLELEAAADDTAGETDDLPAIGAAWTAWIDDFSEDDLDDALRWLDTREAT